MQKHGYACPSCEQALDGGEVERTALGLVVGGVRAVHLGPLVVGQTRPCEGRDQVLRGPRDVAGLIGVLDPQDERASVLAREEVIVERRPEASHVEVAGGTRRETDANARFHCLDQPFTPPGRNVPRRV